MPISLRAERQCIKISVPFSSRYDDREKSFGLQLSNYQMYTFTHTLWLASRMHVRNYFYKAVTVDSTTIKRIFVPLRCREVITNVGYHLQGSAWCPYDFDVATQIYVPVNALIRLRGPGHLTCEEYRLSCTSRGCRPGRRCVLCESISECSCLLCAMGMVSTPTHARK